MVVDRSQTADMLGPAGQNIANADDIAQIGLGRVRTGGRPGRPLPGVNDVAGRDRPAIMKGGLRAQIKGVAGAILADFPAGGQVGPDLQVGVQGNQAAENAADWPAGSATSPGRIEGHGLAAGQDDGLIPVDAIIPGRIILQAAEEVAA